MYSVMYQTESSDIVPKNAIYDQLQAVQKRLPQSDIVIVMIDLDVKVDSDNTLLVW